MCQINVRDLFGGYSHPNGCIEVVSVSLPPVPTSVRVGLGNCPFNFQNSVLISTTNPATVQGLLFPNGNCDNNGVLPASETTFCFEQTAGPFTIQFQYTINAPGCAPVASQTATITIYDTCNVFENDPSSCPNNGVAVNRGDIVSIGGPDVDVLAPGFTWPNIRSRGCTLDVSANPANYNKQGGGTGSWLAQWSQFSGEITIPDDIACGEGCVEFSFSASRVINSSIGTGCADCDSMEATLAFDLPDNCDPETGQSIYMQTVHNFTEGAVAAATAQVSLDINGNPFTTPAQTIATYNGPGDYTAVQAGLDALVAAVQAAIDADPCAEGCVKGQVIAVSCDTNCCAPDPAWFADIKISICDYCGVENLNVTINEGCEIPASPFSGTEPCPTYGAPAPPSFARNNGNGC